MDPDMILIFAAALAAITLAEADRVHRDLTHLARTDPATLCQSCRGDRDTVLRNGLAAEIVRDTLHWPLYRYWQLVRCLGLATTPTPNGPCALQRGQTAPTT
jgi:hypothetical protein